MNLVYFGSDLSTPIFEYLADSAAYRVLALYTHSDPAAGDFDVSLTAAARRRGIAATREPLTERQARLYFANRGCELFFSAEYGRKIPILPEARFRGVNVHNSLLPEGRGYFPVELRLYKRFDYGGVTVHKLAEEIDRGDILLQERFSIAPEDDAARLYGKCAAVAFVLVKTLMQDFDRYWNAARPQDERAASWWRTPRTEDLTITPAMTLAQIRHIFRSFGMLTQLSLGGRRYRVLSLACGRAAEKAQPDAAALPGALSFPAADGIVTALCEDWKEVGYAR